MSKNIFDIMRKLNGISTPIGGISWDNIERVDKSNFVNNLFIFLEDKRVLYYSCEYEYPIYCVQSILHIRQFLTEQLMILNNSNMKDPATIEKSMRTMRTACHDFLTSQQQFSQENQVIRNTTDYGNSYRFIMDLIRLRIIFVNEMYTLSKHYDVKIKTEQLKKFMENNYEALNILEQEQ